MATVAEIVDYVQSIAPAEYAESWDNVGLLCGHMDKPVKKILVALDPFRTVIDEAIEIGADLLVTHHPLIFGDSLSAVNSETETGRCLLTLIEHGVAALNAHTNLDYAPGGINDVLARTLGLENVEVLNPMETDDRGRPYGLLRGGVVPEQPLEQFLAVVKEKLGCEGLRYSGNRPVHKVCVGGGSCGGAFAEAAAHGCDTLVTADVKYNQFRSAFELGINLIDAGHFHTENPTMPVLAQNLQEAFPEVEVVFSRHHGDCMHFF